MTAVDALSSIGAGTAEADVLKCAFPEFHRLTLAARSELVVLDQGPEMLIFFGDSTSPGSAFDHQAVLSSS